MRRRKLLMVAIAATIAVPVGGAAAQGPRTGTPETVREANPKARDAARDAAIDAATKRARADRRAAAAAGGPDDQHGEGSGHLPGSSRKVKLVGRLDLTDAPDEIADVTGDPRRGWAYLSARGASPETCRTGGGFHVADIRNASKPKEAGFIQFPDYAYPGEGAHAVRLRTRHFSGYVLAGNSELCADATPETVAGLYLFDVTNPRDPEPLAQGFGDTTQFEEPGPVAEYHSVFIWQQGSRAFAMGTDNYESGYRDVDIFEITDPRNPVQIADTGLADWEGQLVQDEPAFGNTVNLHDMQVKFANGRWTGLLSYWDGGYVLLDLTDPSNPVFLDNTDWPEPDPEFPSFRNPEGNAHQAWFSPDNRFFIGTDEDFSPYRIERFSITSGPHAGDFEAGEFGWTVPIATLPDKTLGGPTFFGGYGCPADRGSIPRAPEGLPEGQEAILVLQRGPVGDPSGGSGACFFSEKVETAQLLGYDGAIIANHHSGAGGGAAPDAAFCGGMGHQFEVRIPAVCIGHRAMHLLFDREPDYTLPYPTDDPGDREPNVGDTGPEIRATSVFDGWGYVRLFDARTLREIDTYAIEESKDEDFASGFGDLSVHEVQFQRGERRRIAWLSYYSGGVRVVKYGHGGLREVGHYIDEEGNDFWGIDFGRDAAGRTYALASDRDDGLWIFAYTGG